MGNTELIAIVSAATLLTAYWTLGIRYIPHNRVGIVE